MRKSWSLAIIILIVTSFAGMFNVASAQLGRSIDLYGGSGMDVAHASPYPAPFGGQGPAASMDMVPFAWGLPPYSYYNSTLILCANVTLDGSPIQNDEVRFALQDKAGSVVLNTTSFTDQYGVANITFVMPDPGNDSTKVFGVWNAEASAIISGYQIEDSTRFIYDYQVKLWSVGTDKTVYNRTDIVHVTVNFGTYSMNSFQILIGCALREEHYALDSSFTNLMIGGAFPWGNAKNYTSSFNILIPNSTRPGIAWISAGAFDKDPAIGGVVISEGYSGPHDIRIVSALPGDINGDNTVNLLDALILSAAYNTLPGSPNWNPIADINNDNIVNILDAIILSNHYLEHYP